MRYVVVDCETSGLSDKWNKVLTVGLLNAEITKSKLKIIDSEHVLVKHDNYNPSGIALKINRIKLDKHHEVAVYPDLACQTIQKFMDRNNLMNSKVLGHNLRFDFRFLAALHAQGNAELSLLGERVDTLLMWRELKNLGKIPREYRGSLKTLSKFFNVSYAGAHDAIADCHITANVYQNLLRHF